MTPVRDGMAMGFLAKDLAAEMDELRQTGVKFEEAEKF